MKGFTLTLVLAASASVSFAADRPAPLRDVGFEQRLDAQLPLDVTLRDEYGEAVQLGNYFGDKPVILSLVYFECPMLCTLSLNGLASALDVLSFNVGDEFDVVTVSFDHRETPELALAKKAAYIDRYGREGAETGWHFLTGDEASVKRLTEAVGFQFAWDPETEQWAHPAGVLVATPDGRLARYLYGIEYAPKDLRLALVEAAEHRIGSPVDQLLLYCYRYDPATGKYGAQIMTAVRAGGVLTVATLVGFIVVMRRRELRAAGAGRG